VLVYDRTFAAGVGVADLMELEQLAPALGDVLGPDTGDSGGPAAWTQ